MGVVNEGNAPIDGSQTRLTAVCGALLCCCATTESPCFNDRAFYRQIGWSHSKPAYPHHGFFRDRNKVEISGKKTCRNKKKTKEKIT